MTVSRVTNIEDQIDENKARITTLDKVIQEQLNNKAQVIVEGGKVNMKDWSEHPFYYNLFRSSSAMSSPMRRLQRLTITSLQMSMLTPTSAWS